MKVIENTDIQSINSEMERLWVYNGLDCCVTMEVFEEISKQLDEVTSKTYDFSRALQAPILDMMLRGILIDFNKRKNVIRQLEEESDRIEGNLNEILEEGIGVEINWNSPAQLMHLLYDVLGLPKVIYQGKPTVGRDALEKLQEYFYAEPIIRHILALRDLRKKIGVLKSGVDADGRMRTSYNIAGTTTGRLSSYSNAFGKGTNFQNITESLRSIFIADPGCKFAYIDLEQAESRLVGAILWNLFRDRSYLDACEGGDLHTTVCKITAPHLPWTGNPTKDRLVASAPFYRHHTYRDANKVLGHGTNYMGTPTTMAKHTRIERKLIIEFQKKYFEAFTGIPQYHQWVAKKIVSDGFIVSLMGRRRWFMGRRWDDATVREGVAFDPQSSVADILNQGMLRLWRELPEVKLLAQVHDAILVQYPEEREDELLPKAMKMLEVPVPLFYDRVLLIPLEASVGWNWSKATETNIDGLRKYAGHDDRKRQEFPPTSIMDRQLF